MEENETGDFTEVNETPAGEQVSDQADGASKEPEASDEPKTDTE